MSTTQDGLGTDEVQRVGFSEESVALYEGTFTLTFDGQTTDPIAYNAPGYVVANALADLSNLDRGDVYRGERRHPRGCCRYYLRKSAGRAGRIASPPVEPSSMPTAAGEGLVNDLALLQLLDQWHAATEDNPHGIRRRR